MSDEELVLQAGVDRTALRELFMRYEMKLIRYVMSIRGFEKSYAEEVVQDVFLKVWKNIKSFDTTKKFSSWIYAIAHNEATSLFRKFRSRGLHNQVDIQDHETELSTDFEEITAQFSEEERKNILEKALSELPLKYKEILILRYIEDKSYEEISTIIQKPQGTVATLISRAKTNLKEALLKIAPNISQYA